MRRPVVILWAVACVLAGLGGCRDGSVRLSFRPAAEAIYRYEVVVETRTERRLVGAEPIVRAERVVLDAVHRVLETGDDGVRVEVELRPRSGEPQTFVVFFGPDAQLEGFESLAGATEPAGGIGLPEVFPAGAAAPPGRPLAPGDGWRIDEQVRIPGAHGTWPLTGEGRLVELGVVGGEDVARMRTSSRLPLRATVRQADGVLHLRGEQRTEHRATHDLDDGAVRVASSSTLGRYDVELAPPVGSRTTPVTGTLVVRTESHTRRIA